MPSFRPASVVLPWVLVALAGCSQPAPPVEEIRPVRTLTVAPVSTSAVAEFPGEVRPRVETRAGFQVGGRITARLVDVGQVVRAGQSLATLDAQDYRLAAEASDAARTSAQVERDQQRADYRRFEELRAKGFISQADLDRRRATLEAAEARFAQAAANARASGNQAAYAVLRAPHDAVVTAVDAEAGQVVAAGQSVIRLAQSGDREVAIGIPEQQRALLQDAHEITVRLWAGGPPLRGRLRELSPVADPATRTFPARIALVDAPATVALGMTATVSFAIPLDAPVITLPLQALLVEGGTTHAWRYDATTGTVRRTRVAVGNVAGNEIVIVDGLQAGDVVVTAGTHQLRDGQKVKLLTDGPGAAAGPAGATLLKPAVARKG